jgi:hypothetical protein
MCAGEREGCFFFRRTLKIFSLFLLFGVDCEQIFKVRKGDPNVFSYTVYQKDNNNNLREREKKGWIGRSRSQ